LQHDQAHYGYNFQEQFITLLPEEMPGMAIFLDEKDFANLSEVLPIFYFQLLSL
jgi:hypothetical protein